MREKAKKIIEESIGSIPMLFHAKDKVAEFAVVAMAGEIAMAFRLNLISEREFEDYMCLLTENHSELPDF